MRAGDLTIDYDRRRVLRGEDEIRLTPKEFELLSLLARNHDRVLTHRAILKAIWGANAVEQPEHLWTLVAQLRKKIEPDPANPRYLLSEPWVGYRFSTVDRATREDGLQNARPVFSNSSGTSGPSSGRVFYAGLMGSSTTIPMARLALRFRHLAVSAARGDAGRHGVARRPSTPCVCGFGLALLLALAWSVWLDADQAGARRHDVSIT